MEWTIPITENGLHTLISDAAGNVYGGIQMVFTYGSYKGASSLDPPYGWGDVFSLNADGEERWKFNEPGREPSKLSIGDDGALAFGVDSSLYCIGD